ECRCERCGPVGQLRIPVRPVKSRTGGSGMELTRIPRVLALVGLLALGGATSASAAENIDPGGTGAQFAYVANAGWWNAEPSGNGGPGINVTDSALTGYIWSANLGWISLSCQNTASCGTVNYGVQNDGAGHLSGFAWSPNVGWINFRPLAAG